MSFISRLGEIFNTIQSYLIPELEDVLGELDVKQREFIAICELINPQKYLDRYRWSGNGCPPECRLAMFKALTAKAHWNYPTTVSLISAIRKQPSLRRLCGWETLGEVPSEATFSRAFAQFSKDGITQLVMEDMVREAYKDKIVGHISIDSTALDGREKAAVKSSPDTNPKKEAVPTTTVKPTEAVKKKYRKRNQDTEPPEPTRIEQQLERDLKSNIGDLPDGCDWGCKKNSQGNKETWKGYKIHIPVGDGDVPLGFILTSASVHDSQVAIPLMQMCEERVTSLYDLADAAYDCKGIHKKSAELGHIAIIDHNPRGGEKRQFAPAEKVRYKNRTSVERVNSHLHEYHGGKMVMVKGPAKVATHIGFGLLVIAAEQLLSMIV